MVERGLASTTLRVHQHEFLRSAAEIVAIPEARIAMEPMRCEAVLVNGCGWLFSARVALCRLRRFRGLETGGQKKPGDEQPGFAQQGTKVHG